MGLSLYFHQSSLLLVLGSMIFIAYMIRTRHPVVRRRLSYIRFAILVFIILSIPYLLSSIREPQLAAANRVFSYEGGFVQTIWDGFWGFFLRGDANPAQNIIHRPLLDPLSSIVIVVGVLTALRRWWQPRYILLLIMTGVLLPTALLSHDSPNFVAYVPILPLLAITFGIGIYAINEAATFRFTRFLMVLAFISIFSFQFNWGVNGFFDEWKNQPEIQAIYHTEQGKIARHLDNTADYIPTLICDPIWQLNDVGVRLTNIQLIRLMMHRDSSELKYADCRNGLLFSNGGNLEQIILVDRISIPTIHPYIASWLDYGTYSAIPNEANPAVVYLGVRQQLENRAGLFTTTAPVQYELPAQNSETASPIFPPVRFGGNLTFLGYELPKNTAYFAGEVVTVITYWRIDGIHPPDLKLFVHILNDPVTIAAQHDTISVNPALLQERDVFIQITRVRLPEAINDGEYFVSVGAYQETSDDRLSIFANEQPQGDRLFLYPIQILEESASE